MNNILKKVRTERGMSISELSRRTGLSRMAIINIESGKSDSLASTMYSISKELDKEVSDIFFKAGVIQGLQNKAK